MIYLANPSKKKVESLIYNFFDLLDKTGSNTKKYKEKFSKMSEEQFHKYMKEFLSDNDRNFYLEIKPFEVEPSLKDIKNALDYINAPLEEYVYMPYINGDKENPVRSIVKCPTGLKVA